MNYDREEYFENVLIPKANELADLADAVGIPMVIFGGYARDGVAFGQWSRFGGSMQSMSERMIAATAVISEEFADKIVVVGRMLSARMIDKMSGKDVDMDNLRELSRVFTSVMRLHMLSAAIMRQDSAALMTMFGSHDADSKGVGKLFGEEPEGDDDGNVPPEIRDFLSNLLGGAGNG